MFSIKLKFGMCMIDHRSSYYFNFGVYKKSIFLTVCTKCHTLQLIDSKYLKSNLVLLNYLNLYKINLCYIAFIMHGIIIGNYVDSTFSSFSGKHEIILYITRLFFFFLIYMYNEILTDLNLCKCVKAIKFSKSWVESLHIFYHVLGKIYEKSLWISSIMFLTH